MSEGRNIRRSVAWMQIDRVARTIVGVVQVALVARYLGAEQYGSLSSALYIAAIIGGPAALGFDTVLVRWLVSVPQAAGRAVSTAIALRGLSGGIVVVATLGFGLCSGGGGVMRLLMIASLTSVAQAPLVFDVWFRAQVRAGPSIIAQFCAFVGIFLFRLCLITAGAPVGAFAFAAALEIGLTSLSLYLVYRKCGGPAWERPSRAVARDLLRESWPLIVSGAAVSLLTRADLLVLQHLAGATVAGYYSAAMRIVEISYFIPTTIVAAFTPSLLRTHQRSREAFCAEFSKLISLLFWLGVLIASGWCVMAPIIVRLVYGAEFSSTGSVLRILVWISVPANCAIAWGTFWLAERRQGFVVILALWGTAVCSGLSYALVPLLGAPGAALGAFGGQLAPFLLIGVIPRLRDVLKATVRGVVRPDQAIRMGWKLLHGNTKEPVEG